jgi:hypothetical protein
VTDSDAKETASSAGCLEVAEAERELERVVRVEETVLEPFLDEISW